MHARPVHVRRLHVQTGDRRRLRVEVAGDGGRVVVAHVGSPNAGRAFGRWLDDAAARDLTLVTYDRPGYVESTAQPGRTVANCASDLQAIAAAVGFDRCAVWGFSGGGPHALAAAALAPDLVTAVATIGSLHAGLAPGVQGWTADDLAFHSPWGFTPASIAVPARLWHSRDDGFVRFRHGEWLVDAIPGAERAFGETDGHLSLAGEQIGVVHEWLARHI